MTSPQLSGSGGATPEPILDETALDALRSLQDPGEPDVVAIVLDEFRVDAADQLLQMRTALGANDMRRLQRAAHTLKSSAAYVGGRQVSQLSALVETLCRSEVDTMGAAPVTVDRQTLAQLVMRTEAAFVAFVTVINQRSANASAAATTPPASA